MIFEHPNGIPNFPSFLPPEQIEHFNPTKMLKLQFDTDTNPSYYEYGKIGKREDDVL